MTSPFSDRPDDSAGSPSEPDGIAARVSRISSQPPPVPPNRGIVLALIAVAVPLIVLQYSHAGVGGFQDPRDSGCRARLC